MVSIEDSDGLLRFWREQLEGNTDWNSLPNATKKQLLFKLQRCISALLNVYIGKEEILKLIQLTDVPTVFEACLSMLAWADLENKNKHQVLAYLTKVVVNKEIAKIRRDPAWHKPEKRKKRKGKIATIDYARKYDPFNFKKPNVCKLCGNRIRIDNLTGVCSKCQKKGRNGI